MKDEEGIFEEKLKNKVLFSQVVELLQNARTQVLRTVNSTMVYTYFEIGRMIVEEEQNGNNRAEYGKQLLKGLSKELTTEFGKGFSVENLERIRKFYTIYANSLTVSTISENVKSQSLSTELQIRESEFRLSQNDRLKSARLTLIFKLTWSHYNFLIRIDDEKERRFYEIESEKYNWSVRELKRQYDSALYTRLALSRDKEGILKLSEKG